MKKIILTTAMAALLAGGAFAQSTTTPAPAPAQDTTQAPPVVKPLTEGIGHLASNMIGESVYNGTATDAQDLGKVTDLVIAPDGKVTQIIVGVGGFLGIGAKDVALDLGEAQIAEGNGDRWLVVNTTKETLEAAPAFDRTPYAVQIETGSTTPMAPAPSATPAVPMEPATPAPATPAPAEPAPAQ